MLGRILTSATVHVMRKPDPEGWSSPPKAVSLCGLAAHVRTNASVRTDGSFGPSYGPMTVWRGDPIEATCLPCNRKRLGFRVTPSALIVARVFAVLAACTRRRRRRVVVRHVRNDSEPVYVMLGSEGWIEAAGAPWLRPASRDEKESFDCAARACGVGGLEGLSRDSSGRRYVLVAVLGGAPRALYERAERCWRVVRLSDSEAVRVSPVRRREHADERP